MTTISNQAALSYRYGDSLATLGLDLASTLPPSCASSVRLRGDKTTQGICLQLGTTSPLVRTRNLPDRLV